MAIGEAITGLIGGLAKPVTDVLNRRTERKQAKESGQAKLALARQNGQTEVTLTDAEWEAQSVEANQGSWKDEYITIVITSPIALGIVGAVAMAYGEPRIIEGARLAATMLTQDLGLNYNLLAEATVFAALGLKLWRKT